VDARFAAEVLPARVHHGLRSTIALAPARTTGDPQLIERLIANLVENAVRHNTPGGRLDVATYTAAAGASFTIANTGPLIPAGELTRLFQPFQRLGAHAGAAADGAGLGLAIVREIANAHDATITAQVRAGGGLTIEIGFRAERRPTNTPRTSSFALERDRQVGRDDRRDIPRPHHRSVAAEVDGLAVGHLEGFGTACVPAGPDLEGVTPGLNGHLDRLMPVDRSDAAAVERYLESPASQFNACALPLHHHRR
jgi:hypothetical protein